MGMFEALVRRASLIVTHAGAGSIINAVRAGRRPVVMPRLARRGEIIDDHQVELAETLARAGYVFLARDTADLQAAIVRALAQNNLAPAADEPSLVVWIRKLLQEMSRKAGEIV
jgi:UDP-N-acetylglucosamine transferase subunit ALG13